MFRGPPYYSIADEEASTVDEELTPSDAQGATSTTRPTDQTTPTPISIATHNPPAQAAENTARPLSKRRNLSNLSQQIPTTRETRASKRTLHAGPQHPYEPSRAAHTIHPLHTIQLDVFPSSNTRPVGSPPSTLPLSTTDMQTLLHPVQAELNRLKRTTMPPQNSRIQAKSAMQVLKERLWPIGKYVMQRVAGRGGVEYEVWKYIADTYWPQQLVRADALRVMEIYRNAVFLDSIEWERRGGKEEACGSEVDGGGFVYEDAEEERDMPGLLDEALWESHMGDEVWRSVPEDDSWEAEMGRNGELEQGGGYEAADDSSWWDQIYGRREGARGG